jgi:general stress protein YciG
MEVQPGNMTVAEAGRRGGLRTLNRHGKKHLQNIGVKGSKSQRDKHPPSKFRDWGRRGGRPRKFTLKEMEEEESLSRKEADGGRPETPPIHKSKFTPANNKLILESQTDYTTGVR